jgi:hypothetical protein
LLVNELKLEFLCEVLTHDIRRCRSSVVESSMILKFTEKFTEKNDEENNSENQQAQVVIVVLLRAIEDRFRRIKNMTNCQLNTNNKTMKREMNKNNLNRITLRQYYKGF